VLACFGVAPPRPDHAQRAVRAALAIQQAVQKRSSALSPRASRTDRLEIGIGIQSGPVVFGSIGYEARLEYTAIGDPVNVARRLQEMAGPGEILITSDVASQLTQPVPLKPLGRRLLTGRTMPVEVLQVAYP
jgi:adenylate cyclase